MVISASREEQNFYTNRRKLFVEKQLFEDGSFPCPAEEEGSPCIWVRPPTLIKTPVFLEDVTHHQIIQGPMSCNYFPVVAYSLVRRPHLFRYVVAEDQSYDENYAGIFMFRFWRCGMVEPIVIDDVIPFNAESEIFMLSSLNNGHMWCLLMEKAYAKFLGGYDCLKNVTVGKVISDILGCTVLMFTISSKGGNTRLFKILRTFLNLDSLVMAQLRQNSTESVLFSETSISLYTVTSFQLEQDESGSFQWVVNLWQPWILPSERNTDTETAMLPNAHSMTLKEFTRNFHTLLVGVPRYPHLFSAIPSTRQWETLTITGKWANCGSSESEPTHPFARISLGTPDSNAKSQLCTLILSLTQCHEFPTNKLYEIGFAVYGLSKHERFLQKSSTAHLSLSNPLLESETYTNTEISVYLCLKPGQYLIVPKTKEDCKCRSRSRYLLTLYSLTPVTINEGTLKYDEDSSPVGLTVSSCKYVEVGLPIRISANITRLPRGTRYTMMVQLMLMRTSNTTPPETAIKVRLECVNVCQGLIDKELVMWVYFHEYVKFPLEGEQFICRCSAFVHELSVEINAQTVVTTVLPKVKISIDNEVLTGQLTMFSAMLHNTLPLTIRSAKFRVCCSFQNNKKIITGSKYEIPPFSTIWMVCSLKTLEPTCHQIKVYFISEVFMRSARLDILPKNSNCYALEGHFDTVSCCDQHDLVTVDTQMAMNHSRNIDPAHFSFDKERNPTQVTDESPKEMFYCVLDTISDIKAETEIQGKPGNESDSQGK